MYLLDETAVLLTKTGGCSNGFDGKKVNRFDIFSQNSCFSITDRNKASMSRQTKFAQFCSTTGTLPAHRSGQTTTSTLCFKLGTSHVTFCCIMFQAWYMLLNSPSCMIAPVLCTIQLHATTNNFVVNRSSMICHSVPGNLQSILQRKYKEVHRYAYSPVQRQQRIVERTYPDQGAK